MRNSGAAAVVEGIGDHGCEYMTGGVVVVLGPTGRNFAAGMSGGVAFVFDPLLEFPGKCNLELVDLYPIEDEEDEDLLHSLIAEHGERTGSTVAKALLQDWFTTKKQFVKVFPRDYKRVLESQKTASANEIEEEVLGETDAFEKLKAISSLATPVTPANNASPKNVTKDLPLKKVRPTRSAAPTKLKGFVAYERETLGYRDVCLIGRKCIFRATTRPPRKRCSPRKARGAWIAARRSVTTRTPGVLWGTKFPSGTTW